jgi:outer membrane receptor protein involved in Fe transport
MTSRNTWKAKWSAFVMLFFTLVTGTQVLLAKTSVSGIVYDANEKNALVGVNIWVKSINTGTITDQKGRYTLELPAGEYTVEVSYIGYKSLSDTFHVRGSNISRDFYLMPASEVLQEVVVTGKSQAATVRELPFKPQVKSLQEIRAQPVPVTSILNQLPGLRIRQEGGAGSGANIMLNGIDGKGVKVFVDEVPVYLLGAGYSVNTISPNIIDRIEVYKGTIPVAFGSDALGGIINVVTRHGNADYADISYSYGSWNTHEASFIGRKKFGPDKKYFVNFDGFYNYSDNNYWMDDVEVLIPGDPNNNTQTGRARRFNDQFESTLLRLQTGIRNVSWADELLLMASYSLINKEWQHALRAEQPWGEPVSTNISRNASVSWKKYGKNDKWDAKITAGYSHNEMHFVDTALKVYFWDQNFVTRSTSETGSYPNGTSPELTTRTWFSRESFSYAFTGQHTLNLTALFTNDELTIRNRVLGQDDQEKLLPPQKLLKNYTGLALASKLLNAKLTNTISVKHFYMQSSGVSMLYNGLLGSREDNEFVAFGYGDVIQYRFNPQVTINLGYEFTVRQPDSEEIFGNYVVIMPNPSLKPETSHNVNFGTEFISSDNRFNTGATFFYRNTSDRIFLNAVTFRLVRYENLLATRALGVEYHADYLIVKSLRASLNATFQDITLQESNPDLNLPNRFLGARIPNTPYFFGNGQLSWSKKVRKLGNGQITLSYDFNYVHDFFLTWAEDGRAETKDIIPTQALHNVNASWMAPEDRWSIGVECRNLTDARAFDNFSVQRPGRSFYVKARVFLSN